jgi:lipopolysaccharide/colanic/teichoic acid biosynthesis glycosyltransferase
MYQKFFKRFLDIVISIIILFLTGWILLLVSIILYFSNQGTGVFFLQDRPGKNNRIFKIIKFKTMSDKRDSTGKLLPDEERITNIGKFIRSSSIDELPQLLNVIKGDMSLIGPRPLLVQYLPLYTAEQRRRHEIRPGITGWAQCNGRNALSWNQKFKLDVWYVDNYSFKVDLKIILMTISKVIQRRDISHENCATMNFFEGKEDS